MKDSRFRFARDGEIYFQKKKTEYRITMDTYKDRGGMYWVTRRGCTVSLPQDYLADAKEEARKLILAEEEAKKVWVVISEWNLEDRDSYGSTVVGVYKEYKRAKEALIREANEADKTMEPMNTDSEEDVFSYSVMEIGNYSGNHITIKIIGSMVIE
jgi:hypothetical protein